MNYKKIYNELIEKAKQRKIVEGYSELHHIKPVCMGGDNSNNNLVRLTAREHFIAHALLYKIYKNSKLSYAWFSMLRSDPNQRREFSSRQYDLVKRCHSKELKKAMAAEGNPFYGKKHSEETKKKISKANSGRKKPQPEIDNWVKKVASKSKSIEHRKKIGRPGLVAVRNKKTGECLRIPKEEYITYDKNLWEYTTTKQKRERCFICGIETNTGNIKRWHNENCKHKEGW